MPIRKKSGNLSYAPRILSLSVKYSLFLNIANWIINIYICMCVCLFVCVCVCERERERESVCVCVYEISLSKTSLLPIVIFL